MRAGTHRRPSSYLVYVALVLALLVGANLLGAGTAFAQVQQSPDLMHEGGRQVEQIDWLRHLPLALGCALVVVIVDAVVVLKLLRQR